MRRNPLLFILSFSRVSGVSAMFSFDLYFHFPVILHTERKKFLLFVGIFLSLVSQIIPGLTFILQVS